MIGKKSIMIGKIPIGKDEGVLSMKKLIRLAIVAIAVIALGNGMTDYIKTQFDTLYGASGYISIDVKKTNERMTAEDLKEVKMTLPDIKGITPTFYPAYDGKIKTEKGIFLASLYHELNTNWFFRIN